MDLVLGLSMTSTDVHWVLVEGPTAEGATIRRDTADFDTLDDVIAAVGDNDLHAIGVTWAKEAEELASTLLDALADRGLYNVITVSQEEATDALAAGIADVGGYGELAVCLVEPGEALFAVVDDGGVTTETVAPTADDMFALLDRTSAKPEAIFVLGSADDVEAIATAFDGAGVPVITAAEADLALARGAALASAHAVNMLDAQPGRWRMPTRIGALTSLVAAALVAFVVSLSAVVGLGLTPNKTSTVAQRDTAKTVEQVAPQPVSTTPPSPPPAVVEAVARVPDAMPKIVPPAAPAPAPAYVPPAPQSIPAPPPVYVAPVPPPPQPRLRDRIIERIPIINRFHEPQYRYGN